MSNFESSNIWSLVSGGITAHDGFTASCVSAGLKPSEKLDLAVIFAPPETICAATFTQSAVRAHCVDLCIERITKQKGKVRAVLINSGQANACTGARGLEDSLKATKALAERLGCSPEEVLICSTGVIGVPIPIQNLLQGIDPLVNSLSAESGEDAAKAILTTDLTNKQISIEANLGGRRVRIGGIAKGSGMIHPNMATMLGFLTCDASLPKDVWEAMVKRVVDCSFNSITVDGDTSTNDSFIAFASGDLLDELYFEQIEVGLKIVSTFLAKSIARDGEGANCLIEVKVEGAEYQKDAKKIASSICSSSLVKTAVHGCDPNWGRIIAAAGSAGIDFRLDEVSLWIGSIKLMESGIPTSFNRDEVVSYMRQKIKGINLKDNTICFRLLVGKGKNSAIAWGCDLSSQYVHINSKYTT